MSLVEHSQDTAFGDTIQYMQIPRYVVLEKKRGETPLEALTKWKSINPEFTAVPASYAGRLDPMAEGKLLVLLGDECKKQSAYTKLDKEYVLEVLVGVGSDSGDVLGLPRETQHAEKFLNTDETFRRAAFRSKAEFALKKEEGSHSRKYPIFSSKTVHGKPLFLYALGGTLDTITIPEHIETMYSLSLQDIRTVSRHDLANILSEHLLFVPRSDEPSKALGADFRQDEVREKWQEFFRTTAQDSFVILKIRVICSSGSYMRTLADRIGTSLGTRALALSIRRTRIGKYWHLFGGWGIWVKKY
jgi:tRNA pseudouridine(55) synthase